MRKIAIALAAVVVLMVVSCQPPEGMVVTTEQFEALKTEVQTLKTDVGNLQTALDSLTVYYNAHIERYHRGGVVAPKPPGRTVKPPEKG